MSFHKGFLVLAIFAVPLSLPVFGDGPVPKLGQPATPAEIAAWDIDIMIDGTGLPPGGGTASAGQALYKVYCQTCHGPEGIGASADDLVGLEPLTSDWPDKTIGTYWPYATTLFDFIRRSMPMTAPGSLSDDEVYAVTAYLLHLNGIIGADEEMNARTLANVSMPNRDGFIRVYSELSDH